MRALSIRQPWAFLIVNGYKPIENRDWATQFRGPVLIHASKTCTRKYFDEVHANLAEIFGAQCPELPAYEALERGGVVGMAEIVDCLDAADVLDYGVSVQQWFTGEFGFLLKDARPLPFYPFKGALSFFDVPGFNSAGVRAAPVAFDSPIHGAS